MTRSTSHVLPQKLDAVLCNYDLSHVPTFWMDSRKEHRSLWHSLQYHDKAHRVLAGPNHVLFSSMSSIAGAGGMPKLAKEDSHSQSPGRCNNGRDCEWGSPGSLSVRVSANTKRDSLSCSLQVIPFCIIKCDVSFVFSNCIFIYKILVFPEADAFSCSIWRCSERYRLYGFDSFRLIPRPHKRVPTNPRGTWLKCTCTL